jgi:hypothetical protein
VIVVICHGCGQRETLTLEQYKKRRHKCPKEKK